MELLAIDIETYSSNDLLKTGVHKYVEATDFTVLLFSYSIDGGPVQVVDLAQGEDLPDDVFEALTDPRVVKTAYNALFERVCLSTFFMIDLPAEQWECTMAKASQLGLPLSLDAAAKALKLEQEKSAAGKGLIRYFCVPCKPTKTNGGRTRNLPQHAPEKWEAFKAYCAQDVVVEQAIREKISWFEPTPTEKKLWVLDQRINDSGILIDPVFVKNAVRMDTAYRKRLYEEAVQLTGLSNPNSASQLKQWLTEEIGEEVTSLTKTVVPDLLKQVDCGRVKRVLEIRQEMAKTSVKKYMAMVNAVCRDNRVRGLLQYYGANRTGRWAGRLVQVQNLPRNEMKDLDLARQIVKNGDLELLELQFGNVPNTLSQLIRTAFVAAPGHRFIVADFSAIEAVVIAWLAGEKWRMEVFRTHGKIYEASAAQMFKVPIESITKASPLRQKGKVAELALGYQGGPYALISMGALRMGIEEEELPKLVVMWRQANPAIVRLWNTVGAAAMQAVQDGITVKIQHGILFFTQHNTLFVRLPSGRMLCYSQPRIRTNERGMQSLCYVGVDQTTKKWELTDTYGGKLVENIVQAIARDLLAEAMLRLDDAGYKIVMHVHDEVVIEVPVVGKGSVEEVNDIMSKPVSWAPGLPLRVDSYETAYYKKD